MDASTATIVVVLFVITIFSSLGKNEGSTPSPKPAEVADKPAPFVTPSSPAIPAPEISEPFSESEEKISPNFVVNEEDAKSSIKSYIANFRSENEAKTIADSIIKHSLTYDVNPKLIAALIRRESRFNPRAVSKSGAIGLGQLLPSTCKSTGVSNAYDIDQNAKGTVRYMKYMLEKFKDYKDQVAFALAGYLEGPNAVARNNGYKSHTAGYISDIINIYNKI
jgi:soluble lytic murein transglycosylase-like protein